MPKTGGFPGIKHEKKKRASRPRRVSAATFINQSRNVSSELKAMYHNVTGVGPKGTLRRFFDLNRDDQNALRDGLEKLVGARLKRT